MKTLQYVIVTWFPKVLTKERYGYIRRMLRAVSDKSAPFMKLVHQASPLEEESRNSEAIRKKA
jgi:hypothetical protein